MDYEAGVARRSLYVEARRVDRAERAPASLTLVFVGPELALSDIGIHVPGRRVRWLNFDADAHVRSPFLARLELFPIAWPDLRRGPIQSRLDDEGREVLQRRE